MPIEQTARLDDYPASARPAPSIWFEMRDTGVAPRSIMTERGQSDQSPPPVARAAPQDGAVMAQHLKSVAERRDKAAFEELFRYFAPRLKAYMLKLGADTAQAEELMQEAMVSVWRKADRFDPAKAAPSTWIFTIARNLRIDAYRKASRPEPDPNDPAFVPASDAPADDQLFQLQMAGRLKDIIADLPEDQRAMLQLSYYEDKSHSQISEECDIPLGTVKSRLRLALQKVRHALGEDAR